MFPPGLPTYSLVASGQCAKLLAATQTWNADGVPDVEGASTTPLYTSAAYACLGRWNDAVRVYGQINVASPDFHNHACARLELLHWLTALIDARRRDATFFPVFVKSSARSPCLPDGSAPDTTTTGQPETTTG